MKKQEDRRVLKIIDEQKRPLSLNIVVREEKMRNKRVFIVNNEDLGVADFGDTLDRAIENFKKSVKLYLDTYPEKKCILLKRKTGRRRIRWW